MDEVKDEKNEKGALKAAWKFCGLLLSLRPTAKGFGPRLGIKQRKVSAGAGGNTAGPGSAPTPD